MVELVKLSGGYFDLEEKEPPVSCPRDLLVQLSLLQAGLLHLLWWQWLAGMSSVLVC